MKIAFSEQPIREAERQYADRSRAQQGKTTAVAEGQNFAASFGRQQDGILGSGGEKGKSLIEIQQEAGNIDAGVAQDYMIVMSHTMSDEDYAKMQEEGFDFSGMDPEEAVTIVDRIKAELVRSGKNVEGYTDDVDVDTLAAALGSEMLAKAIADSFQAADVPLTKENLTAVSQAWTMCSGLQSMEEGSYRYLIDNEMEAEIWNLYLAQNSGAEKGGGSPRFYAEDVQGYYTQSAGKVQTEEIQGQIDRIIEQSGREVNEQSRGNAAWLLEKGLPLTAENLNRLEELQDVELPVTEERFAEAAAAAIAEGRNPEHASLTGERENIYEKAAAISDYYHSSELWEMSLDDITARRQLEEIRLRMTAEVNVKLLKSGFSIDSAPMEELIEALKQAEEQLAQNYFPSDAEAVEKYRNYQRVNDVAAELPGLPADVVGGLSRGRDSMSLEDFHREGRVLQDTYEKAQASYETLMTTPSRELGDSIQKAFANVDDILKDLGLALTDENRRAVRILGYNRMEMTLDNLEAVREADRQVQHIVEQLTPAATLKMIRDGINPLEKNFEELEQYFEGLPVEYKKEAENYSRFLYGLEKNNEITPEERESFIGIYRLVRQIEKADGAAVGTLVNSQAELHFSNLLSAVRSGKVKSVDFHVADEMDNVVRRIKEGGSISEQISRAFVRTTDKIMTGVSQTEEITREYNSAQLEEQRQAVNAADRECIAMLQRGELPASADNLMAAQALNRDTENLFEFGGRRNAGSRAVRAGAAETAHEEPAKSMRDSDAVSGRNSVEGADLWQKLDSREEFAEDYTQLVEDALGSVEEATFAETERSVDVRHMQLNYKQLTVAAALARQEEYYLPMYIGDTLARVHLTFDRSGAEKGTVTVGVSLSEEMRMQARLYLDNGTVHGIFFAEGKLEVNKLQETADTFREEAQQDWTVGNISVVASGKKTPDFVRTEDHARTESAELYRVAKAFLQSVARQGE